MPVALSLKAGITSLRQALGLRDAAAASISNLPGLLAEAERAAFGLTQGDHAQRRPGTGPQFWQFRDYTSQDRPQDIDWRQSGKSDRLLIREKEKQAPQRWTLWCANGAGMGYKSAAALHSKQEAAHIITLALAMLVARAGDYAALLPEQKGGRSDSAITQMAETLTHIEGKQTHDLPSSALSIPAQSHIAFIGDFWQPLHDIQKSLQGFAARSSRGVIIQICDPDELNWPFTGRLLCDDQTETSPRHRIENAQGIKAAYQDRIKAHQDGLKTLSAQFGWMHFMHRTDTPPQSTMQSLWAALDHKSQAPIR